MITKTIMCPNCKNKTMIQGNSGEKIQITCPTCNTKGVFVFPKIDSIPKSTPETYAIEVANLTKRFKDLTAVNDLSFKVKKGEIFGFLGPNGAGKTTTIKSLLRLIHVDSGELLINGLDIKKNDIEVKKNIGYLPERIAFYENLTPLQTLNFFCELKGVKRSVVEQLIQEVGLEDAKNRKVGTFSKGMVQLLGVAQVMIGNPSVYILDEPMGGLDARWVKIIREKIKMLNEKGATVIFSSHILTEVENLCNRVAIIDKGTLIAEDTVSNLNKYLRIKPRLEISIPGLNSNVPEDIKNLEGVEAIEAKGDMLFVTCESHIRSRVITVLENAGLRIAGMKTIEPSLEEAFVKLVTKGRGDV
jgi:ABC-type multidrug transport system ATPase subunit